MKASSPFRLALLGAALLGCSGEPEPDAPPVPHVVLDLELARQESFSVQREYAGLVLPRQSTELGFERAGEVLEITVDEGERVAPGAVVARLDTELLAAERDELAARQDELAARLELNRANLARARELRERGFAAAQEIDELVAEQGTLTASRARLDASLAANVERLRQSELVAPFGGTVSRRFVDRGAVVDAGAPVLRIIEDGALEARVGVPVRSHRRFRPGDPVEILAAGEVHAGTVLAVGSDVTRATLTLPLRIALPPETRAVAGDQAYLRLRETVEQAGFWVPLTALTDGVRGLWNVYALEPVDGGALHRLEGRDVRILYADEERAFVDGALADGEHIAATGLQRLVPGERVRIGTRLSARESGAGS